MRRPPDEGSASDVVCQNEMLAIDEEFLHRVDRVMLQRKQADPFRLEAVWRATEEEARLRQLQLPEEDPVRSNPR